MPTPHTEKRPTPRVLVLVWLGLLALTALTVAMASLDFGRAGIVVALLIAATKSGLVAAWFMHLRYEKVSLYLLLLFISFAALGIAFWLTLSDIAVRY